MQSKKRAKAVKFGEKQKKEDIKKEEQATGDSAIKEEPAEEKVSPEDKTKAAEGVSIPHGVEAHFSSVQTLDIKELPDEEDAASDDEAQAETNEAGAVTKPTDETVPAQVNETPEQEETPSEEDGGNEENEEAEPPDESPINKDGAFFNSPPDDYDNNKRRLPYYILVTFIAFLLGLAFFAGIYYAVSNKGEKALFPKDQVSEVTQEPETTPTEKPVDLTKYNIRVLNGTGTSGVAARVRGELESAGFKVGSVGNADRDDYEETEIATNTKVEKEYTDKLREFLSKSYKVGAVSEQATGAADVTVTIGSASGE